MKGEIMDKKKKAVDLLKKTKQKVVKTLDQDNDNKVDLKDLSIVANAIGDAAKQAKANIKENLDEKNFEKDINTLKPLFEEDVLKKGFSATKLVRITNEDKKRADSVACKGAVGYMSYQKDVKIINMYYENVDLLGLSFYPDKNHGVYYVDPVDENLYIASDLYFSYLKTIRVNELQKIAQDLGAIHFKVTYKGTESSSTQKTIKANANIKKMKSGIDGQHSIDTSDTAKVEIAAESTFPPHDPIDPQLKYLKKDPSIQTLVAMRLDEKAPLKKQKFTLNLSTTSGVNISDAIKIDAALKALKVSGGASFTSIANSEAKSVFEYEIDFE